MQRARAEIKVARMVLSQGQRKRKPTRVKAESASGLSMPSGGPGPTRDGPPSASKMGPVALPLVLSFIGPQSPGGAVGERGPMAAFDLAAQGRPWAAYWLAFERRTVLRGFELLGGELVVGELGQEVVGEVRTPVAEVDVIGVLPHVQDEERLTLSGGERQSGVGGLRDLQAPVLAEHQPGPAGAELAGRGGLEGLLEFVDAAEVGGQPLLEVPRDTAARRRQAIPEEAVVPMLARVVEDGSQLLAAVSELDHFLERLALERIVFVHEAVECGDIRLMVLAMVEFERLLAHAAGGKRTRRKRKRG